MKIPLSVILFFIPFLLFAGKPDTLEDYRVTEIATSASFLNFASSDELYTPLVYSGTGVYGSVRVSLVRETGRHVFEGGYVNFRRQADGLTMPTSYYLDENRFLEIHNFIADLSYRYERKLKMPVSTHVHFYLCGEIAFRANMINDLQLYPEVSYLSMSPGFKMEYVPAKRHAIEFAVYAPVFLVYLRNNYATAFPQIYEEFKQSYFIKHNVHAAFPGKLRSVVAEAGYNLKLYKWVGLIARYRFGYLYLHDPRPLKRASGLYTAGLTFNL